MAKKDEQAKVATDEGQDENVVVQPETEPEIVTPEAEIDEGKEKSEGTWEQRFKTLEGMYKQEKSKNTTFDTLLTEVRTIGSQVKQQGETLELHTEILSSNEDLSEEAQERVRKTRQAQEERQKAYHESQETLSRISKYAGAAGLTLEHEALKPAKEAFEAGKSREALDLTIIACIGSKKELPATIEKPVEEVKETGKKENKPNLKVLPRSSAPSKEWADMSSNEKILLGLAEAERKRG